jgi:hypothetical protein
VFNFHEVNSFGYALGLIPVNRFGAPGGDGAEATATGADIAEDHKGGGTFSPTFAHIGAVAAFADGMEFMRIYETTDMFIVFADRELDT